MIEIREVREEGGYKKTSVRVGKEKKEGKRKRR